MKRALILAVTLTVVSLVIAGGAASAARRTTTPASVTVVMHDPGCHWFSVDGVFKRTLTVKGPAILTNEDMAALDIVGGKFGMHADRVGKQVTLSRGTYRIVMVGQASDDNVLKLLVK
jgi:hypothetical protein